METLGAEAYVLPILHAGSAKKKKQSKKEIATMPMEQAFMHCDKDTLKMAMLKHEETFRQQVRS